MNEKICKICKEVIRKKDDYVRLTDYHKGEFHSEGFYHTRCYINQIKHQNPNQQEVMNTIMNLANRTDKLLVDAGV